MRKRITIVEMIVSFFIVSFILSSIFGMVRVYFNAFSFINIVNESYLEQSKIDLILRKSIENIEQPFINYMEKEKIDSVYTAWTEGDSFFFIFRSLPSEISNISNYALGKVLLSGNKLIFEKESFDVLDIGLKTAVERHVLNDEIEKLSWEFYFPASEDQTKNKLSSITTASLPADERGIPQMIMMKIIKTNGKELSFAYHINSKPIIFEFD